MSTETTAKSGRRGFLAAATGGLLILKPETVFGTQANSNVELGLIGCGGRGNWIGEFFPEYTGARFVAMADVVRQNLDATGEKFKVDAGRLYYGPDAYNELVNSKLDAVVIETPTYYHPQQAEAAVAAGKHVYVAKPIAVDVPGALQFLAAGRRAKGKVSFLVDFQTRARPVYQEAAERIHRGDVGKPAMAQVFYYAGRPGAGVKDMPADPEAARMKAWYRDRVLSGEIIVEQNIHVIDVANWFLKSHPLKASGTGGRTDWTGTNFSDGDAWDHFVVTFWYPETHVTFSSHQLNGSFSDLCVRVVGVKGAADTHYGGLIRITGENPWLGAEQDPTFKEGAVTNVKNFVESIRTGQLVNNVEQAVESNLTAILGRMAAYKNGAEATWKAMLESTERWEADLKLRY